MICFSRLLCVSLDTDFVSFWESNFRRTMALFFSRMNVLDYKYKDWLFPPFPIIDSILTRLTLDFNQRCQVSKSTSLLTSSIVLWIFFVYASSQPWH